MRSKASAVTGPAGLAKHQVSGTISAPACSSTSMAPAQGTEVGRSVPTSVSGRCRPGKPPGRRNSFQPVGSGAIGDTVIADGVKIDNQVQVGHNCRIGEHTVISGCVGISGSVTIGRRCMLGGMVGVVGHLEIADDVYVTGKTMITHSIRKPGLYSGQLPFDEARRFRRNSARFQQLDALARRVRRLERGGADEPADEQDDNDND